MNVYEIEEACLRYSTHPVLSNATLFLYEFAREVNHHSDGWPYWKQPRKAAAQLMGLIKNPSMATDAALARALRPIKSFYTRRGYQAGMKFPGVPALAQSVPEHLVSDLSQRTRTACASRIRSADLKTDGMLIDRGKHGFAVRWPSGFDSAMPDEATARRCAAALLLLETLKTTAGNIRSLGPAGALNAVPYPYREWLRVVEAAIGAASISSGSSGSPET